MIAKEAAVTSAIHVRRVYDDPGLALLPATAQETGDAACWAHLVCLDCGAVVSEGHREDCQARMPPSPD
jgi:hypothetical protein